MEVEQKPLEDAAPQSGNRREVLRLIVAVYFMALAMRLLPDIGGLGLFATVLPATIAPHAYAISVFTAAWFILAGQRLPWAASFLIAFTIFSQAFMPAQAAEFSLLRQVIVITSLMLVGGFFDKEPVRTSNPGRIRLVRVKTRTASRPRKPEARRPTAQADPAGASATRSSEPAASDYPFAPVREEMDMLFEQIAVTR